MQPACNFDVTQCRGVLDSITKLSSELYHQYIDFINFASYKQIINTTIILRSHYFSASAMLLQTHDVADGLHVMEAAIAGYEWSWLLPFSCSILVTVIKTPKHTIS